MLFASKTAIPGSDNEMIKFKIFICRILTVCSDQPKAMSQVNTPLLFFNHCQFHNPSVLHFKKPYVTRVEGIFKAQ